MKNLQKSEGVSLLNIILPKEMVEKVSDAIIQSGAKGVFQISARGSVLTEGSFFERIFPPPSPEQVLLQALVSDDEISKITDSAIESGKLNKVGSGAVFSMSCNDAHISSSFPSSIHSETNNSNNSSARENLEAICCICEKGIAEQIAKAALD